MRTSLSVCSIGGVRTIVRDVNALRQRGVEVPRRWASSRTLAPARPTVSRPCRLYLQGLEANEIARRLYHTLGLYRELHHYVRTCSVPGR